MEIFKLDDMVKGYFIGNFDPSIIKTNDVEIAIKTYKKGESEQRHYHKIATEITAIITGKVKMNGNIYDKGDIVVIKPYESTDFEALEDSINVVVKIPGANNDKYLGEVK